MEKAAEYNIQTHYLIVDFHAVYDSVIWEELNYGMEVGQSFQNDYEGYSVVSESVWRKN